MQFQEDPFMKAISSETYSQIDNNLYEQSRATWWEPNDVLYLLKTSVNPVRVGYAKKKILGELKWNPKGKKALEVGCGGGILCEEIALMGFETSGIDPSTHSLEVAKSHARNSALNIDYSEGTGESIRFPDQSFDIVFCCDVLEHVRDLPKVISEISRVLKPGGVFCFDTLNRTFVSKLVAIKIWQEWKRWAFMPPNLHVWEMFIKPSELKELFGLKGLEWKDYVGSSPNMSIPRMLSYLRKRAKGELTYEDLGEKFWLIESHDMNILYGGYAIKK